MRHIIVQFRWKNRADFLISSGFCLGGFRRLCQKDHGRRRLEDDRRIAPMPIESTFLPAAQAGTITLGGDLTVNRMGFGAMRVTGKGIWGLPDDVDAALATLRRAVELGI